MSAKVIPAAYWSTASYGSTIDTSPMELSALGEHLDLCRGSRGHLFALHCVMEAASRFVVSRFVTTLVAIALLIGAASLML